MFDRRCSTGYMFLKNSQNSQGNTCARPSSLIKLQGATLLKKRHWQRCFRVSFAKLEHHFYETPRHKHIKI